MLGAQERNGELVGLPLEFPRVAKHSGHDGDAGRHPGEVSPEQAGNCAHADRLKHLAHGVLLDDMAELVTEHAQYRVFVARKPYEAVEHQNDPAGKGEGVDALVAGRTKLEPVSHARSCRGRRPAQPLGDASASLHVEDARSHIVLVEDAEHLLPHALLEARRYLEGQPAGGGRESPEVEEAEHRYDKGQRGDDSWPPLLQAHGDRGAHAPARELAREGAVGVEHFECGPARQPDHARRTLERLGDDRAMESVPIHEGAVHGLDDEVAVVEAHDDGDSLGMTSVEAKRAERGQAHSPISNPNASVAPSPAAVTGRAATLAARAESGTPDSMWTHWMR